MEMALLFVTVGFLMVLQITIPFIVKRTVVFGVTIPVDEIRNEQLLHYKKLYAILTFFISILALALYFTWSKNIPSTENHLILAGLLLPFVILFISMSLYFYFHMKVTTLKREKQWFKDRKQVKVSELNLRTRDEMLPWIVYVVPMVITVGLMVFTLVNYNNLPDQIPTHWGPDGKPDSFTTKTYLSALTLPLVLLVMNAMFLGINELTRNSGIKLSAGNIKASRVRQLRLRKYTSWLLFFISILISMLFTFLQFNTLYENSVSDLLIITMPLAFSALVLIGTVLMAIKVGKKDSDLDVEVIDEGTGDVINADDDQYWKGGLFYFNPEDPSIFVEKRFGVGWTLNFARPLGYLILVGPLLVIVIITLI
ncbi:DUF1648 domain-containing protein [Rossellomorea yichunensis]|jgi:uncharacterized membrane protein|uniref:DUF1648 domain-containing protein n=1 Tax=Rossellomorea yichunensis TaxID=3077331 RepID=UPI0028E09505|nr:DUF5808 domain-containing protein [Rossellomorea sp. YC4-1]MDT9027111.1 DUF5808 domain-containing protein [Rossellomorea sp. YC4-1]